MQLREREELVASKVAAEKIAATSTTALKSRLEELESLLSMIGHEFDLGQIGVGEPGNKTKVIGAMQHDIDTYGGDVAQPNYSTTIVSLRNELDNVATKRDQVQGELAQMQNEYRLLQEQNETRVQGFEKATDMASSDLQDRIRTSEETIAEKDSELTETRANLAEVQLEKEQEQEAFAQQLKSMQSDIVKLNAIRTRLQERLDEIEHISFERPDGTIVNVNNSTQLVWLNIGSRDNLKAQTTFSVYDKNNKGVGRTSEDIKAQIEVVKVWPGRAEARILKADIYRPITPGDVIYSPLWEAGRTFSFSFVGFIDLDGDGIYDRDLLHDLVTANGAEIDNEVGDDGEWIIHRGINVNTKFLVVGEIPDPSTTERDDEKERFEKITTKNLELTNEARLQGTRKVNLNDFLAYIGYKSQRRLYIPGLSNKGFVLKQGARSTGVNDTIGRRNSTGKVSEIFNKKRTGQKTSTGKVSGAYSAGGAGK
ncbi:MAG: hypothetical protein JKY95_17570 [Planctomycetaceae bacterium]|nr:hypothetical protein [Planctomycetaceae bacterium]